MRRRSAAAPRRRRALLRARGRGSPASLPCPSGTTRRTFSSRDARARPASSQRQACAVRGASPGRTGSAEGSVLRARSRPRATAARRRRGPPRPPARNARLPSVDDDSLEPRCYRAARARAPPGSRSGSCPSRPTRCRRTRGRTARWWSRPSRIASTIARAVACGSHSSPSDTRWIARSIPSAIASRSCSSASAGPSVRTTDSPPWASISRTASSTPHSSCGLIVNPRCLVSIACASSVSDDLAARQRDALDADEDPHERIRAFSGSKIGVEPTTSTVTG